MERKQFQEDIILHENVPRWHKSAFWILEKILGNMYVLECVMFGPDLHGIPMTRARCFLAGRHMASVDVARPFTADEFKVFLRQVQMCADGFFMASPDVVAKAEAERRTQLGLGPMEPLKPKHWMGVVDTCRWMEQVQSDIFKAWECMSTSVPHPV